MTATVLTQTVARLVLAPVLTIAVAILVNGYAQVGDGFSAGVIAALGLLLQYLAFGREEAERLLRLRYLPAAALVALLAALALALAPMLRGDPLFTHYPRAGADVVEIGRLEAITAVAFDVAVFALVVGAVVGIVHAVARAGEEAAR